MKTLNEAVAQMPKEMKLPDRFLVNLLEDEDWSFVIKAHAFLEALLTHALTESLGRPDLGQVIGQLDISDTRKGKARFAQALNLLGGDGLIFIRKFSELRNDLVHKVENITFSFTKYIDSLDRNQRKSFIKSFAYFASEEDLEFQYDLVRDLVLKDTKQSIWYSLLHFAGVLWWKKENAKLVGIRKAIKSAIADENV